MADVRALLKAKRQEARISHLLAAYTSSGQLRCIACETSVKHASAWEGHIGSKAHRTNAARLKERRAQEAEEQESLKRKAMEAMEVDDDDRDAGGAEPVDEDTPAKKRRVESEEPAPVGAAKSKTPCAALPADFFSDPSMAPPPPDDDGDEAEEGGGEPAAAPAASDGLDAEWEAFQQSVVNAPDFHETYERATVAAEAVLSAEVPQGFPSSAGAVGDGPAEGVSEKEQQLDEEGRRRKKEQDERELIMDRLMEEEQAQEEADERVSVLKNKLEALRKRREAVKAAKKGANSS